MFDNKLPFFSGAKAESGRYKGQGQDADGVRGLKSLGVRDLHHKNAFLACNVITGNMRIGDAAQVCIFIDNYF